MVHGLSRREAPALRDARPAGGDEANGRETTRALLTAGLPGSGAVPTAIVGFNDWCALGALRGAVSALGVAVPAQLSLIGFDNTLLGEAWRPGCAAISRGVRDGAPGRERLGDLRQGGRRPAVGYRAGGLRLPGELRAGVRPGRSGARRRAQRACAGGSSAPGGAPGAIVGHDRRRPLRRLDGAGAPRPHLVYRLPGGAAQADEDGGEAPSRCAPGRPRSTRPPAPLRRGPARRWRWPPQAGPGSGGEVGHGQSRPTQPVSAAAGAGRGRSPRLSTTRTPAVEGGEGRRRLGGGPGDLPLQQPAEVRQDEPPALGVAQVVPPHGLLGGPRARRFRNAGSRRARSRRRVSAA